MSILIWPGALISLVGVAALLWCIRQAAKARKAGLDEDQMKARLQQLVAWNMGALAVSAMGLMLVVIGILLG